MGRLSWTVCLLAICLLSLVKDTRAVKIRKLLVPPRARDGEDLKLTCIYDLEGQSLYSLNWWKDNQQFYHYSPTNRPLKTAYETPGIDVIIYHSNSTSVLLRNTSLETSGEFRCEVMAEFPTYERDSATVLLEIVEVPRIPPIISLSKKEYSVGEILEANCTSIGTRPPSQLAWYLNGKEVPLWHWRMLAPSGGYSWTADVIEARPGIINVGDVDRFHFLRMNSSARSPIVANIKMALAEHHFIRGRTTLSCVAVLSNLYHRNISVELRKPGVLAAESFQRMSNTSTAVPSILILLSMVSMTNFGLLKYGLNML